MDDTPRLKAGFRRKRLICLGLALFVCWALYQWYYIPKNCSGHGKFVWMWTRPDYPKQDWHVALFKIPSININWRRTHRSGGHVEFLELVLTKGESAPNCLRELKYTHKEGAHWITRFPDNDQYRDGFDLKRLYVNVENGSISEPDSNMHLVAKSEYGFEVYKKNAPDIQSDYIFFRDPSGIITRSGDCERSEYSHEKRTLCSVNVRHNELNVHYTFHSDSLANWREIENQVLAYVDSIIILKF